MKTINDDPYEFFQQGGWTFLGGTALDEVIACPFSLGVHDLILPRKQSEPEEESETESEFEAEFDEASSSESEEEDESDYDGSDASDDEGSDSGFDDESEGDDWDELERKAAKGALQSGV